MVLLLLPLSLLLRSDENFIFHINVHYFGKIKMSDFFAAAITIFKNVIQSSLTFDQPFMLKLLNPNPYSFLKTS